MFSFSFETKMTEMEHLFMRPVGYLLFFVSSKAR